MLLFIFLLILLLYNSDDPALELDTSFIVSRTVAKRFRPLSVTLFKFNLLLFSSLHVLDFLIESSFSFFNPAELSYSIIDVLDFFNSPFSYSSFCISLSLLADSLKLLFRL